MQYWLGIDCGGTFIKAALFNKNGKEVSLARRNLPVLSPSPGRAERDPQTLWETCAMVIREAIASVNSADIMGIGISAQGKGLFALDIKGKPLGNGIISSDQRALPIVKRWQHAEIPETLYPQTRQTLWTGHPVAILRALKEQEPERYTAIASILMSHDFLRYRLTGKIACEETNISESNLYHFATETYDAKLAGLLDIEEIINALPPIIGATEIAGGITADAAKQTGLREGTPVVGGLFDVVSSALCAGLHDETMLNVVLGTWSVVTGLTNHIDENQTLPFYYGKSVNTGEYIVHEASPTSAANLEWVTTLLGETDYQKINDAVSSLPPADSSVFFVPFLYGSNAGLGMQAGIYGLQSFHTRAHIYQAVFEGVIFSLMTHLERMMHRFPNIKTLRTSGGPTKSAVWMQMLADICGKTVEVLDISEVGCLGAALVAMIGTGAYPDSKTACIAITPSITTYHPNPILFDIYAEKYRRYHLLVSSLKTFNQSIQNL
ncbi:MAG: FGGY-family carbohydrate kinase [Cardiobacteriaceae bacterium]|nr:FGGY-family carbohydrate kinase [Cardiobacteriaceae bacterium]